jgi:hypothetical protein
MNFPNHNSYRVFSMDLEGTIFIVSAAVSSACPQNIF